MTRHAPTDEFLFHAEPGTPTGQEVVFVPRTRVLKDPEVREIFEHFWSRDSDLPMDILPVSGIIGRHHGGTVSWSYTLTRHAPIGFFLSPYRKRTIGR
jgi:hypothetical protein